MASTTDRASTCTCGCGAMTTVTEAEQTCTCGCACCAPVDRTRDEEIAELRELRDAVEQRLAELEAG
jgi:hypothetical protein